MTSLTWLIVAVIAGALIAYGWIKREMWIRRRRRDRGDRR
jgi:hypothetical protein